MHVNTRPAKRLRVVENSNDNSDNGDNKEYGRLGDREIYEMKMRCYLGLSRFVRYGGKDDGGKRYSEKKRKGKNQIGRKSGESKKGV